jgi:Zn-dependent protease/CBS domain-containing protein
MGPLPTGGAIGRLSVFGIPIRFHFTFVLLVIFLLVLGTEDDQSFVENAIFIAALFGSVFVHEVAHALAARRFKIRTVEILLLPLGGVSKLERQPQRQEELWIALAGPITNLLLGGAILGGMQLAGLPLSWEALAKPTGTSLGLRIGAANLLLGLFNLLPAFPMDGGRILRAALAARRPETEATRIAARVGTGVAVLLALYGLLSKDFFLVFIAFFLYLGALQEGLASTGRSLMRGARVSEAMITDYRTLRHGDTIRDAAQLLLATSQQDFPVLIGEQVAGLLTRGALLRAMAAEGPESYVAGAMNRNYLALPPGLDLTDAAPLLGPAGACALVMDGERLLGMLTTENLSEFLMLRQVGHISPPA